LAGCLFEHLIYLWEQNKLISEAEPESRMRRPVFQRKWQQHIRSELLDVNNIYIYKKPKITKNGRQKKSTRLVFQKNFKKNLVFQIFKILKFFFCFQKNILFRKNFKIFV
jgi:hypothetical protein